MLEFVGDISKVNDTSIIIRLVLAVISGGIIGFERGKKGRPAGFRTHILVCLGSALVILTNQYIYQEFGVGDPARLGAQVISGIGFLGVGTIIITRKNQVKGLTTAAGLWTTACMGLAIGIGFYRGAIVALLLIWFVAVVLRKMENSMLSKPNLLYIYVEFSEKASVNTVLHEIKLKSIHIDSIEIIRQHYGDITKIGAILSLRLDKKHSHEDVIRDISIIEGIDFTEDI